MTFKKQGNKKETPLSRVDYDFFFSTDKDGDTRLHTFQPGILTVNSGEIVACDPLVFLGLAVPLNKRIRPGRYPVIVCVAESPAFGERYALVKLQIDKEPIVKWELAFPKDLAERIAELKEGQYYGFPVDAGLACFCDNETQICAGRFYDDFAEMNPDGNVYDDYFAHQFKKNAKEPENPYDAGDWLDWSVPGASGNVIMFHSGFGDGLYPVYWGLNQQGEVSSLLIDFGVLSVDK